MDEIKEEVASQAPQVSQVSGVKKMLAKCSCGNKQHMIAGVVILALIIAAGVYFYKTKKTDVGLEGAKTKVADFVNGNLLPPGMKAEIKEAVKENDLYKVTITVGKQDVATYLTMDGKKFFPEGMDTEVAKKDDASAQAAAPKEIPKSDAPTVELFVMSYCPYGTQMEKGILPVVKTLGSKIKYSLKFVDYAMHGDKEIAENLRQYCIEKTQPARLSAYLTCFLKKGEGTSDACLKVAGVASATVDNCVKQTDDHLSITKDAADKEKWSNPQFPPFNVNKDDNAKYAVQGSPTLVINGVVAESGRDSASILKTICGAFNTAPKECAAKLSATAPAAGFGEGAAPAADSAAPAASCATPPTAN